jgi:3-phenylpropionate/trans-cinnamate dioxygenase ferredoxin reductase subunit
MGMTFPDIAAAAAEDRVVIVGGGQAGAECAANLRMLGFEGAICILSEEPTHPYSRPPLSKGYLLGEVDVDGMYIRPPSTYDDQHIDVRLSTRATAIDRDARVVRTQLVDDEEGSAELAYDWLVLATGGRARLLPDTDLHAVRNVHTLRRLDDIERMRDQFSPGSRLVVLGGGYIGLEVAAVARKLDLDVTVVEAGQRVLARVTVPVVSEFYERVHKEQGVDIRTSRTVESVELGADGAVDAVRLSDGVRLPVDVLVVGIGMAPNDELAAQAGLAVDDGVLVDDLCRTDDPRVLAIGDCTRHPCAQNGGYRRVESVPNAVEQAKTAAAVLTGDDRRHDAVPWFWSDQYDVKLQVVGLCPGHDQMVLRGSADEGRSFSLFYLQEGAVRAADVVNSPRDFMIAKKLVAAQTVVDVERLADPTVPLKELLPAPRTADLAVGQHG